MTASRTTDAAMMQKSFEVLEKAASEISDLGLDSMTVSEMFFAYGIHIGILVEGSDVFDTARGVIDAIEMESRGK